MGGHTNHQTPAERVVGNRTAHGELAVSVDAVLELEQEAFVVLVALSATQAMCCRRASSSHVPRPSTSMLTTPSGRLP
jgi:hypothetical protein